MAQEFFRPIRQFIDIVKSAVLVESEQNDDLQMIDEGAGPWGISRSDIFDESLAANLRIFPDLREKLQKFIEVKIENPMANRYGKHDRAMTGPLSGFYHCHLRDDAVLIYNLVNRCVNLVCIVSHAEIEGKRLRKTAKKLAAYA